MTQRKLQGRLAIVTGASRRIGIGAATCRALAAEGADILMVYWSAYDQLSAAEARTLEPLALQQELQALGVRCERLEVDLSQSTAYLEVMSAAVALGSPSILVNNACYSANDGLDALDADLLDRHYAINVRATTMLTTEFARRFRGESGGRVISLTSGQSLGAMQDEIAYALTKGTVETLTTTLAPVLAARGITINAVNPGPTDTGWMDANLERELLPRFPFGRIGKPEDAARLIAFLASDEAQWITGQVIHSEGAFQR
ncbi:SDR family oxidoreductase [Tumebacillus permanentifrigoris]|uniref:3-oxoacyl-[acyl-carrier protein] reductase n=1 Tax=Tumebacillus permanentifrigoris TaxID=378543 RepID=A0A316DII4_9BACL|nr:SDR family oxidoreductase [Tumebacillus permanentifrigoris]PWK16443.1 3-oxoacyl-[acyl-carrier protein] reductase [Tumebacillus permanentifrigoris]